MYSVYNKAIRLGKISEKGPKKHTRGKLIVQVVTHARSYLGPIPVTKSPDDIRFYALLIYSELSKNSSILSVDISRAILMINIIAIRESIRHFSP